MQIDVAAQSVRQIAATFEFRIACARNVGTLPFEQPIRVHGQRQRGHLLGLAFPRRVLVEVFACGEFRFGFGRGCIVGGHRCCRNDISAGCGYCCCSSRSCCCCCCSCGILQKILEVIGPRQRDGRKQAKVVGEATAMEKFFNGNFCCFFFF